MKQKQKNGLGFSLIELMIGVAIVAVLAAVAIPAYQGYIYRTYVNEATTSISAIKSAEESFFSLNGCYVDTTDSKHPDPVPRGTREPWDPPPAVWNDTGLAVRPDRRVRFQYYVIASYDYDAVSFGCESTLNAKPTAIPSSGTACVADASANLVADSVFGDDWYVVVAHGDLDADGEISTIVSAIDDSAIITCNEIE